jgi:putative membrane protein
MMWQPSWRPEGNEPDYRFSLANERAFLAWLRTALSLLASGVLLVQFATRLSPRSVIVGIAVGLTVLATLLCALAYTRWRANEIAMRHGRPLPTTRGIPLAAGVLCIAAAALGAVLVMAG